MNERLSTVPSLAGRGDVQSSAFQHRMLETPEKRWERAWVWCSERVNPIVVKEVRQSLKSRQFSISFGLTLIAAIGWTLVAVSMSVPRMYYLPGGMVLLAGYFCILTLPLMVIIPFSTFRSLTAETDDSTFELLSISALSASQIVYGKMASGCVQMVLYLSALAPCIVLTYLLRGVSLFAILLALGLTVAFSLGETALALLFAAIGRTRMVQSGISVLVLAGLMMGVFAWLTLLLSEALVEFAFLPSEVSVVLFALLTVFALAISLVLNAAAAAIDFPSENHSTPLRVRIVALLALITFWSLLGVIATREAEGAVILLIGVFIALMFLGGLITGEYGVISPRAQRTLPKTFFGRVFLTWLYPGAGLGYIFVVSLFGGLVISLAGVELFYTNSLNNWFGRDSVIVAGYLLLGYLAFYLGLNRLLMLGLPKTIPARMLGSITLLAVTLLLAHLIPLLIAFYWNDYREFDYAWHQAFNIVWSVNEAIENGPLNRATAAFSSQIGASMLIVTLCAIVIFGLNLVLCTRDVLLVRVAEPPRVREDKLGPAQDRPAGGDLWRSPQPPVVDPFAPEDGDQPSVT